MIPASPPRERLRLLYPPRLTRDGEKYLPADGYHRILATIKLGYTSIPAIIEEKPLNKGEMIREGFIANTHRVDNTPLEKAEAIALLMEFFGWNASTVAQKLGLSNATVSRMLSLLQLPEQIREQVHRGEIPLSSAMELKKVGGDAQASLATQVASGALTRDALAGTVKAHRNGKDGKGSAPAGKSRVCCNLPSGSSVTVCGQSLGLDDFITALEEVLAKARKARSQGIEVSTLAKMFRDQARA